MTYLKTTTLPLQTSRIYAKCDGERQITCFQRFAVWRLKKPVSIRELKLHVSGNGKRQVRTFLAKFSLNVFVSYLLSCVERIIMYFSFKTASSFTFYCLIP